MKSRAYAATRVNCVNRTNMTAGRAGQAVVVGVDVGKYELFAVARWGVKQFERPWRVPNPAGIRELLDILRELGMGRALVVALEPSGTYGDALRQALHDAGIDTWRVSPKAAHDYAEVFDGVPSQHDGKDAAVVAELAALGKAEVWRYEPATEWDQELAYWVDELEGQRRILSLWLGRIEALLGRYWPEATRVMKGSSGTLLRVLSQYGGVAAFVADPQAEEKLRRWGGTFLKAAAAKALLASARASVGVRQGAWECRQLREYAERARRARQEFRRSQQQLRRLAAGHAVLEAQGKAVGIPTACVLWVSTGDPRAYASGAAYRKAMGLNLVERSSGTYQGVLRISKRGHSRTRQWLYFAALRLVQRAEVRPWYEAKKVRDGQEAKRALVAVMRKLAMALHHVSDGKTVFEARRLFPGKRRRKNAKRATAAADSATGRRRS